MGREPRGKGGGGALWKFRFGLVPSHKQDPIQNSGSCSWIMKARVGGKICVLQVNIFKLCHINSKNVLLSCLLITVDFFFLFLSLASPYFTGAARFSIQILCVCVFWDKRVPPFPHWGWLGAAETERKRGAEWARGSGRRGALFTQLHADRPAPSVLANIGVGW